VKDPEYAAIRRMKHRFRFPGQPDTAPNHLTHAGRAANRVLDSLKTAPPGSWPGRQYSPAFGSLPSRSQRAVKTRRAIALLIRPRRSHAQS
jgi:hypothetical protein